jgi:hypothetical protein
MSKQRVSSPCNYVDIMKLSCGKRLQSSLHMASAHTTSTSLLSDTLNSRTLISGAVELAPQNANMVRFAPDHCHAKARNMVWVTLDTHEGL